MIFQEKSALDNPVNLRITKLISTINQNKEVHLPRIDNTPIKQYYQNNLYFNYYILEQGLEPKGERVKPKIDKIETKNLGSKQIAKLTQKSLSQKRFSPYHKPITLSQRTHQDEVKLNPYFSIQMPLSTKTINAKKHESQNVKSLKSEYPYSTHITNNITTKPRNYQKPKQYGPSKFSEFLKPLVQHRSKYSEVSECQNWDQNNLEEDDHLFEYVNNLE